MIMLLAAMSMQVFAQEVETVEPVEAASDCTHNWVYDYTVTHYTALSDAYHAKWTTDWSHCSICGAKRSVANAPDELDHVFGGDTYTGNGYHIGATQTHKYEFMKRCSMCGHVVKEWKTLPCPGNGNCLYP